MKDELFDDLMLSLNQALDYAKGDKTKARSIVIEIPDEEIKFYSVYNKLSEPNKQKAMQYVNELLQTSNGQLDHGRA